MFALKPLLVWFQTVLRKQEPLEPTDDPPYKQIKLTFKDYLFGKQIIVGKDIKQMQPLGDDVYEFRTPDVRVFGWFYTRDCFIAVCGDTIDNLKRDELNPRRNNDEYNMRRDEVIRARNDLDLDEPKWIQGARLTDVLSV